MLSHLRSVVGISGLGWGFPRLRPFSPKGWEIMSLFWPGYMSLPGFCELVSVFWIGISFPKGWNEGWDAQGLWSPSLLPSMDGCVLTLQGLSTLNWLLSLAVPLDHSLNFSCLYPFFHLFLYPFFHFIGMVSN